MLFRRLGLLGLVGLTGLAGLLGLERPGLALPQAGAATNQGSDTTTQTRPSRPTSAPAAGSNPFTGRIISYETNIHSTPRFLLNPPSQQSILYLDIVDGRAMVLRQTTYGYNFWTKSEKKWEHPILRSKACLKNPAASEGPKPSQSSQPGSGSGPDPASACRIGLGNLVQLSPTQSPLDYLFTAEWEEGGKQQSATTALSAAKMLNAAPVGRYDALCQGRQKCVVQIQKNRLIVGDQEIPIEAITRWKKAGPGENSYGTLKTIATWLTMSPLTAVMGSGSNRDGLSSYSAAYVITYTTPTNSSHQISIGFVNQSVSRFFESELLATLNLPEAVENRPPAQGKDRPPPAAGDSDRR